MQHLKRSRKNQRFKKLQLRHPRLVVILTFSKGFWAFEAHVKKGVFIIYNNPKFCEKSKFKLNLLSEKSLELTHESETVWYLHVSADISRNNVC